MAEHAAHGSRHYVKIWGILVALLVVSVVGPMFEIAVLTLITAFGVAIIKAYLVARNFMQINIERKWVAYLLLSMIGLVVLFVGGVAPDVLKHEGQRWDNVSAKETVKKGLATPESHGH